MECKRKLARSVQNESWEFVYDGYTSSEMASRFHEIMKFKIDECCPTKEIKVNALSSGKPKFPTVQKLVRRKK